MIRRTHSSGGTSSVAVYSPCERYRYSLQRVWDETSGLLTFIMLNPSKADEVSNDPTVERCERRARALGFGGFCVVNIFAWRETDPQKLRKARAPIGPANDESILTAARASDQVIAAWGTHGAFLNRGPDVTVALQSNGVRLHHLGLSKAGHPRHPLYLSYTISPEIWDRPYEV